MASVFSVANMKAAVDLGKLTVQVVAGTSNVKKKIYNTLLSFFDERIQETVEAEVRQTVNASMVLLTEKVSAVIKNLAPKMGGGPAGNEMQQQTESLGAGMEPEPEPEALPEQQEREEQELEPATAAPVAAAMKPASDEPVAEEEPEVRKPAIMTEL